MKRYSAYKDSGVKWIGEIPSHWKIMSLRNFIQLVSEKNHPQETLLSVVREQGVIVRNVESKEENHNFIPNDLSNYKLVHKGQFVINKMKAWQGSYAVSEYTGIVSPAYYTCNLRFKNKEFFNTAIRSKAYIPFFTQYSKGIRVGQWDLAPVSLKEIPFICPPENEQDAIVRFLDDKVGKIDHLTDQTTALIERLKELKQSVIARAVTRGLNPNVKMKPSGISWVGEIPKHWETKRFGSIFKLKTPISAPEEELLSVFLDKGVIYASESANRTHNASEDLTKYQLVEPTDFVMNNQQAWRGSVGVSAIKGIISPAYHIFKLPKCYDPTYANYLLRDRVMVNLFDTSSKGVGSIQRTLNFNWLNGGVCVIPPMNEQIEIAKYLNNISKEIDFFISKKMKEVGLLKELRQRTISDAVTGKIKVTD